MRFAGNQYACTCICALRRKAGLGMRHHLKRYNYAAHGAYCNCSPNAGGIASDIAGAYSANRRDHTGEHRRIFDQYGKYSEHWNRGLNMLNQFSRTQLLIGQKGMERLFNARVAVFGIGGRWIYCGGSGTQRYWHAGSD